jgi:hypothetical protein
MNPLSSTDFLQGSYGLVFSPPNESLQDEEPNGEFTEPESAILPSALEEACSQLPTPPLSALDF